MDRAAWQVRVANAFEESHRPMLLYTSQCIKPLPQAINGHSSTLQAYASWRAALCRYLLLWSRFVAE